jgi:hypothetical protein
MQDFIVQWFSSPDTLTPRTVIEMFVLFALFEFIGMLFSFVKKGAY